MLLIHGVLLRRGVTGEVVAEYVSDGRQSVGRLGGWHVVDMRGVGQLRRAVLDVPGQRVGVVDAAERLAQGRRLNHPLVGEVLVRGSNNRQARRRLVPARHSRRLGSEAVVFLLVCRAVALRGLLLQAGLDEVSLLLADRDAPLDLLPHDGILGHETRRQTGQADLLNAQCTVARRQGPTGGGRCAVYVLG